MSEETRGQREPYTGLINSAHDRYRESYYQEAVILAQTGAELFIEQAFDRLFRIRDLEYLRKEVERLLGNNFNLGHDKVASLYEALSGDDIRQRKIWSEYKTHTELRNDVVHHGREVTAAEAERSLDVVGRLIEHVGGIVSANR